MTQESSLTLKTLTNSLPYPAVLFFFCNCYLSLFFSWNSSDLGFCLSDNLQQVPAATLQMYHLLFQLKRRSLKILFFVQFTTVLAQFIQMVMGNSAILQFSILSSLLEVDDAFSQEQCPHELINSK